VRHIPIVALILLVALNAVPSVAPYKHLAKPLYVSLVVALLVAHFLTLRKKRELGE
jgi:hypothetical protein